MGLTTAKAREQGMTAQAMLPKLDMLGLHRGSPKLFDRLQHLYGTCGDARDKPDAGAQWHGLPSRDMITPLMFVGWLNMGPLVIRRQLFRDLGGFNSGSDILPPPCGGHGT